MAATAFVCFAFTVGIGAFLEVGFVARLGDDGGARDGAVLDLRVRVLAVLTALKPFSRVGTALVDDVGFTVPLPLRFDDGFTATLLLPTTELDDTLEAFDSAPWRGAVEAYGRAPWDHF